MSTTFMQNAKLAWAPNVQAARDFLKSQGYATGLLNGHSIDAEGNPADISEIYTLPSGAADDTKGFTNAQLDDYIKKNGTQVNPHTIIPNMIRAGGSALGASIATPETLGFGTIAGGALGGAAGETFNKYLEHRMGFNEDLLPQVEDIAGQAVIGGAAPIAGAALRTVGGVAGRALAPLAGKVATGVGDYVSDLASQAPENTIANPAYNALGKLGQIGTDVPDSLTVPNPNYGSTLTPAAQNAIKYGNMMQNGFNRAVNYGGNVLGNATTSRIVPGLATGAADLSGTDLTNYLLNKLSSPQNTIQTAQSQ